MAMFIWMMLVLKIPIAMLLYLVWWSAKAPDQAEEERIDGSGGHGPGHRRPRRPRPPRRGPHAAAPPRAPKRVRAFGRRLSPARH